MGKFIDLTNKRFGRLVAVSKVSPKYGTAAFWKCICDCGKETIVISASLRSGMTTSCGCFNSESLSVRNRKHGFCHKEAIYEVWKTMRARCLNKNSKSYARYGGRGITVCEEWSDYQIFRIRAFENGYAKGLSIDRIDVNGNYCPENCRWADDFQQAVNTSRNIFATVSGVTKSLSEWERALGIYSGSLSKFIKKHNVRPKEAVERYIGLRQGGSKNMKRESYEMEKLGGSDK
jgi:hypothetical protein